MSRFKEHAPAYWSGGYAVIPMEISTKRPANGLRGWTGLVNGPPSSEVQQSLLSRFGPKGLGLLLGTEMVPGEVIGAVDVDDDALVRATAALLGDPPSGKIGKKGATFFVRVPKYPKLKSTQLRDAGGAGKIDILMAGRGTVLPPTLHPDTQQPYVWLGRPLLECAFEELPLFDEHKLAILRTIVASKYVPTLIGGTTTHDAGVAFTAQLVAVGTADEEITAVVTGLLPASYDGNSLDELPEWIKSARDKGFGAVDVRDRYEPGDVGPIPLGRAGDDFYFRCQQTNELVHRTAKQLCGLADLFSLASHGFWLNAFPRFDAKGNITGVNVIEAGDGLIQACTRAGNIDVSRIRGFGVWEEDGRLVANTGGQLIESDRYIYSYRINLSADPVPMNAVTDLLGLPNWAELLSGLLLLGWAFVASFAVR